MGERGVAADGRARDIGAVMKSFRCCDVVAGCTRTFSGLEDDILKQVRTHARDDHGLAELPDEVIGEVRSYLVPVAV